MPILRNAGGDILLSGSVPALVRAWTYNSRLSGCVSAITIIGCDPPACIRYKNTNVSPDWFEFIRGTCGAWSGSGGYVWPADIPDCPYPDGISIEETECTEGGFVYLCIAVVADGPFTDHTGCGYGWNNSIPGYSTGNAGHGGWSIGCTNMAGMNYEYISIDCAGNVSYVFGGPSYGGGTGTPISLDSENLPIGVSVIPVYSYYYPYNLIGTLTITVSKC